MGTWAASQDRCYFARETRGKKPGDEPQWRKDRKDHKDQRQNPCDPCAIAVFLRLFNLIGILEAAEEGSRCPGMLRDRASRASLRSRRCPPHPQRRRAPGLLPRKSDGKMGQVRHLSQDDLEALEAYLMSL